MFNDCHAVLGDGDMRVCIYGDKSLYIVAQGAGRADLKRVHPQMESLAVITAYTLADLVIGKYSEITTIAGSKIIMARRDETTVDVLLEQFTEEFGKVIWTASCGYEYGAGWTDGNQESI
jgi:hypothetical protein